MSSIFVNEKITVKNQLQRSFGCITVFAGGVTLAICLGMVYALASDSYSTAKGTITDQSKSNLRTVAQEISNSIDQQLRVVAESVCMTSALYSSILIPYSSFKNDDTLLADKQSYKEYYFLEGCSYPHCPRDYGRFNGKSRLPPLSGFTEGSLTDTSVYLYSSRYQHAMRNDSMWSSAVDSNPTITNVIDGLIYQNSDFETMYSRGPNTTVMFYLAAQISTYLNQYDIVHRTYPGILKNVSNYDSSHRPWFQNAPEDAFWLYGPYKETFTKQFVVTLSSRKQSSVDNKNVTIVSGAVMLLSSLKDIVNSVTYTNDGFGALIKFGTNDVLVWGDRDDLYNEETLTFKTVSDFDPVLAGKIGTSEETLSYADNEGVEWVVAVVPFFSVTSHLTSSTDDCLMLLVFGKKSDIEHPLIALQHNISNTTNTVTVSTLIIVLATIGVVMLLVCLVVWYITYPLAQMIDMSQEIVHIAAETDDKKDYTTVLNRAHQNMSRSDEVGLLALDYYHIVCLLHNKNIEKKCIPKYPENPFYNKTEKSNSQQLTWPGFFSVIQNKMVSSIHVIVADEACDDVIPDKVETASDEELSVVPTRRTPRRSRKTAYSAVPTTAQLKPAPEVPPRSTDLAIVPLDDDSAGSIRRPRLAISADIEEGAAVEMVSPPDSTIHTPTRRFSVQAWKESLVKLPSITKNVTYLASIKSQLYALCGLLLVGVFATMVVTIIELRDEGSSWMSESGETLLSTQVVNLQSITDIKAVYVKNFFAQLSLDLLVGQAYFNELIDLNLTRSNYIAQGDYLPSYSADTYNPYYELPATTSDYSSYFIPTDAGCQNTSDQCASTHTSNQTRMTSLFDVKLRSYFHTNNIVSFLQFGVDSDGFTRYLPYNSGPTYSQPTSCFIGDTTYSSCLNNYYHSACYSDSGVASYPVYDPRCRTWYQLGVRAASAENVDRSSSADVYFQYPRVSSSGAFVVTAVVPIVQKSTLFGVLISNFLVATLSDAINSLTILDSGYVYLIDSSNTSIVILHPDASSSCHYVSCAEDFSFEEYWAFHETVLLPLQNKEFDSVASTYQKDGETWQLSHASVMYGSVDYTLISTVPRSEILKSSSKIHHSISKSVTELIIAFAFAAAFFLGLLVYIALMLVRAIVNPIHDLHAVLERAKSDDLTGTIPSEASSLDMKILMEAFTKFMISLRFGSDSYARGNPNRALRVFSEALELYHVTGNKSGMGASLNNLAVVELSLQHFDIAKEYNQRATQYAKELLVLSRTEEERAAYRRTLSDREGNLALILLEQDQYTEALEVLERLLVEDKKHGYIKGCVVKQGTLGQYYLKRGELAHAQKTFQTALDIVQECQTDEQDTEWNKYETATARQIALFNMALLQQAQKVPSEVLIHTLLMCLTSTENIHTATTTKALVLLRSVFERLGQKKHMTEVKLLAEQYLFNLHLETDKMHIQEQNALTKRVAFVMDYSGSMNGTKIASAIENVKNIFENQIYNGDSIMLVTFNAEVRVVLRLTTKTESNTESIQNTIKSVTSPSGSSAFYDALKYTLARLETGSTGSDWIIALTDGEDNASHESIDMLIDALNITKVNLIVMGIGSDVQSEELEELTGCMQSAKGIFIAANGDRRSIDEAFAQVTLLIQGQLILEDI